MLNIIQWNGRSVYSNKSSLQNYLIRNQIHVAALSETWFKINETVKFTNYKVVRCDRYDEKGGSAIVIHSSLKFTIIGLDDLSTDDFQICGINLMLDDIKLSLISIYIIPTKKIPDIVWTSIMQRCGDNLLICGDFNAHSPVWGCAWSDSAGSQILDVADEKNLTILNDGSPTLLPVPNRNNSAIDLTLCSSNIAPLFTWRTEDETLGSNHLVIFISFFKNTRAKSFSITPSTRWNTKKANWEKYRTDIENKTTAYCLYNKSVREAYEFLQNCIEEAADKFIPLNKPKCIKQYNPAPWWNVECSRLEALRKKYLKIYKKQMNMNNYIKYKEICAKVKKLQKKEKKKSWEKLCENMNRNSAISDIWKNVRLFKNAKCANNIDNPPKNTLWLEDFADTLAPSTAPEFIESLNFSHDFEDHFLTNSVTINELLCSIKTNSKETSPGLDNITYAMISNLPVSALYILIFIFNKILNSDDWIENWNTQIIIPLRKPNKDPNLSCSYRPIALSSCLFKTFERILKGRLDWWIESNSILPQYQHAYRKNKGTLDSLSIFVTDIYNCFSNNEYLTSIFLDISGAYNYVHIPILLKKLLKLGIPRLFVNNIKKMLKQRTILIRHNNKITHERNVFQGLPQGSILSPLLFNLYTMDLGISLGPQVNILQYADDFCIYCSNKNLQATITYLKLAMQKLNVWMNNNNFEILSEKSSCVIFTRHRTNNLNYIIFGPYKINLKTHVKFLGMFIDSKMTWKFHIENLIGKTEKCLNIMRSVCKTRWGADPKISLMMYKALIRSRIDYGSILYNCAPKYLLTKVDRIQYKSLRLCIGAMKSSPVNALQVEAAEMPLALRRQMLSDKFILNKIVCDHYLLSKVSQLAVSDLQSEYWINKSSQTLAVSFRNLSIFSDQIKSSKLSPLYFYPYEISFVHYKIKIPNYCDNPRINLLLFNEILENDFADFIHIYTDGSKLSSNNLVGAAYYCPQTLDCNSFKLASSHSSFSAELIAIYLALNSYIKNLNFNNNILIISDCQSALLSIENNKNYWLVAQIRSLIWEYKNSKGYKVEFMWVKGHTQIMGNEIADFHAKQGAVSGDETNIKLLASDLISNNKLEIMQKWQNDWKHSSKIKGQFYAAIQPKVIFKPWFTTIYFPRRYITMFCRLRLGHTKLPSHLKRIGIIDSDRCLCDNTSCCTIEHIVFCCTRLEQERTIFFRTILKKKITFPTSISILLSSMHIYENFINLFKTCPYEI